MRTVLSIDDARIAINDIDNKLNNLLTKDIDFSGRRITNAGRSQADSDYVTRAEITGGFKPILLPGGVPGSAQTVNDSTVAKLNLNQLWTGFQHFKLAIFDEVAMSSPIFRVAYIGSGSIERPADYFDLTTGGVTGDFSILDSSANIILDYQNFGTPQWYSGANWNPIANITYSLGLSALRWNKLWVKDIDVSGTITGGGGSSAPFIDSTAIIKNAADATKLIKLDASLITTTTTRTLKVQDASYILAGIDITNDFTQVQRINGSGVLTLGLGQVKLVDGTPVTKAEMNTAGSGPGSQGYLRLGDTSGFSQKIQAFSGLAANITWTLPGTDSSGTQALVSNGSGALSWASIITNPYASAFYDSNSIHTTIFRVAYIGGGSITSPADYFDITTDGATGTLQIKNSSSNILLQYLSLSLGQFSFKGIVIPDSTNIYDLGASGDIWKDLWISSVKFPVWTSYSPTPTYSAGTITVSASDCKFRTDGKTTQVRIHLTFTVGSNGVTSSTITVPLPANSASNGQCLASAIWFNSTYPALSNPCIAVFSGNNVLFALIPIVVSFAIGTTYDLVLSGSYENS